MTPLNLLLTLGTSLTFALSALSQVSSGVRTQTVRKGDQLLQMKQFDREGREMFFFWDREEITDIIATEFDSIGRPVKVVDVSGQRLERFTYTYEYW